MKLIKELPQILAAPWVAAQIKRGNGNKEDYGPFVGLAIFLSELIYPVGIVANPFTDIRTGASKLHY